MENKHNFYEKKSEIYYAKNNLGPGMRKILKIVELLSYKNGKSLKILDIGCGSGVLGQHLKKKGHSVFGVEISEKAGNKAKKVLDDVVIGDIEEIELPWCKNYFDVVICNNVLEHLFDPEKVLIKLKEYLKENGIIIIGLPNIANWKIIKDLIFGNFNYTEIGLLDYGHIRFFTPRSAMGLIIKCGYSPVKFIPTVTNFPYFSKFDKFNTFISKVSVMFIYHFIVMGQKGE